MTSCGERIKFCCVTPCLNAEKYILDTMYSVLNQSLLCDSRCELHYVIQDGGSTDKTVEIAKQIVDELPKKDNIKIEIFSEKDSGMYDALSRGFSRLSIGDIYSYINAGDFYSIYAFEIATQIMSEEGISFLTGLTCVYNEKNHLISCKLPFKYERSLLLSGCYGIFLPFIQQESTFWDYSLQMRIDINELKKMRLAGDYLLWKTFIQHSKLYIVSAQLGGFKLHANQLTELYLAEYNHEMKLYSRKATLRDMIMKYFYKIMWYAPDKIKKNMSGVILEYDHVNKKYIR